ncbi:MAG: MATE family efflux transporter [Thermoanaerobacterales bacterium]|jgi:putative MATE family efflux protein|nr:MATE family efflux transporter [Thermoanaerobacterales bacterium]
MSAPLRLRSPYDREIARLALPAFGALVAEPVYVLTDTAIVGHLGTPQLGGLAVAASILLTLHNVFIFLAYGTTAAVSRLLGAGHDREAAHQAVQSVWLAVIIGAGLVAVGWVAAEPLVGLMGATGDVRANALLYLRISLAGLPAMFVTLAGTGYLRGLQDTRTPLVIAVATGALNLATEVALIYGLGMGLGASALTTVVAQSVAAAVYLRRIGREALRHGVDLAPDPASLRRLGAVGRDLLVRTLALRASLLVATAVATRLGDVDVAAHQIAFEIWSFLALALDAIAIAGQALVGRALGAGDGEGAKGAGRRMIEWGVVAGVAVGVLVFALSGHLPGLFSDDAAVVDLTAFVLLWVAALQPVNAVAFVLDGILIGAGDMRFLAWAMAAAAAVFVPAAAAVAVVDAGIGWLWAALGLLMVTRAGVLLARFAGDRWVVLGAVR